MGTILLSGAVCPQNRFQNEAFESVAAVRDSYQIGGWILKKGDCRASSRTSTITANNGLQFVDHVLVSEETDAIFSKMTGLDAGFFV